MQISLKDLMKTIFVKFKRVHVLFMLFVFVYYSGVQHISCYVCLCIVVSSTYRVMLVCV